MARLVKEATEPEEKKKERESLEITPGDANVRVTVDTLATTRDTSYWQTIRNLPLQKDEVVSYQIRDSIKHTIDSLRSKDSLQNRRDRLKQKDQGRLQWITQGLPAIRLCKRFLAGATILVPHRLYQNEVVAYLAFRLLHDSA